MMTSDGLRPSNLALNALINAFGEDRRDVEAFAVLQYMQQNASIIRFVYILNLTTLSVVLILLLLCPITGTKTGYSYLHYSHESVNSCGEI